MTSPAGTDLRFTTGSIPARINAGRTHDVIQPTGPAQVWLPAGEAYATVDANSAAGTLIVPHMTFRGIPVTNLRVTFESGRITNLDAETNGQMIREFLEASSPEAKHLSIVDVGVNPHSHTVEGSHYNSWEMGGMVTLAVGNNSWAGGTNGSDAALSFHLADATLTIGDTSIVRNGDLQSQLLAESP